MRFLISALMLLSLAQFTVADAHDPDSSFDPPTIRVTGKVEVAFPPDFIVVRTGVLLRGADPASLHADIRKASAEMLSFVKSLDIEARDVVTDRISVTEVEWGYDDNDCPVIPEEARFEGRTSLKVILREFDRYEELITGLFKHGANRLGSVTFDSTLRIEKTREARIAAVRSAREKAAYIAGELGQTLGRPLEVTETSSRNDSGRYSAVSNADIVELFNAPIIGSSSISATDLEVSAKVTVVFELLDAPE